MKLPHHPFRFGIINERALPPQNWLAHIRHIEALGFASVFVRDHFVPDFFGEQYAPLSAMMAAAMATSRLNVGSMVIDNDYRHPVMLAKEAATINALSGGRLELGLGAGWLQREYDAAGRTFDANGVRVSRLEESLKVLKGLWSGAPFSHQGTHYTIKDLNVFPASAPKIFIGGGSPRVLKIAGREADIVGFLTTSVRTGTLIASWDERTPEAVAQKVAWVAEGAGEAFAQRELSMIPTFVLTNDREAAASAYIAERGWPINSAQLLDMPYMLFGTHAEMAQQLRVGRERYGVSYIIISDQQMDEMLPLAQMLAGT
jgi:probable F420-dependent oxidoreductase